MNHSLHQIHEHHHSSHPSINLQTKAWWNKLAIYSLGGVHMGVLNNLNMRNAISTISALEWMELIIQLHCAAVSPFSSGYQHLPIFSTTAVESPKGDWWMYSVFHGNMEVSQNLWVCVQSLSSILAFAMNSSSYWDCPSTDRWLKPRDTLTDRRFPSRAWLSVRIKTPHPRFKICIYIYIHTYI